jgi:hypothetical protein
MREVPMMMPYDDDRDWPDPVFTTMPVTFAWAFFCGLLVLSLGFALYWSVWLVQKVFESQ